MANDSLMMYTTVGRKIIMAITGLFLISFLVVHLAGNFLLFQNDQGRAFNEYTVMMTTNPLIRIAEIVLVLGFLIHIILSVKLTSKNTSSRPIGYAVNKVNETASIYSRNMGITGSIILIFLILHLKTFWFEYKFGAVPAVTYGDGIVMKNMFAAVEEAFSQWWYVLLYLVSMVLLGGHLNHGFQSAFRSVGLNNKRWAPNITRFGTGVAVVIALGFSSMPIIFYLRSIGVI
jgi:succinate dehydrogenase / fumarate reductase, cytochrome b subunit